MARKTYKVVYERDESGYWVAEAPAIPQCYAQGRSLQAAKRKLREVLTFLKGDSFSSRVQLAESVNLDGNLEKMLLDLSEASEEVEAKLRFIEKKRRKLIRALSRKGYSRRDVGELLGLSHQRVDQILTQQ